MKTTTYPYQILFKGKNIEEYNIKITNINSLGYVDFYYNSEIECLTLDYFFKIQGGKIIETDFPFKGIIDFYILNNLTHIKFRAYCDMNYKDKILTLSQSEG